MDSERSSADGDFDDSNDAEYTPQHSQSLTQSQAAKKPKKKPNRTKVTIPWGEEEKSKLIKAIEERRCLWDKSTPEYKLPKVMPWQEVADIMAREDYNVNVEQCKALWTNLRVTFNTNLNKYRSKKSGQGADESVDIVWKHLKSMLFLEASNVRDSTTSTSSMPLVSFSIAFISLISRLTFFVQFSDKRFQRPLRFERFWMRGLAAAIDVWTTTQA